MTPPFFHTHTHMHTHTHTHAHTHTHTQINHREKHHDVNITDVWSHGITGRGVVVAVVDDGRDFPSIIRQWEGHGSNE